jgi:hypothetical protein
MPSAKIVITTASVTLLVVAVAATPARAQIELSGEWTARQHEDQPHRGGGADLGDYTGLPINDAARLKADTWDASILTLPEKQCLPHPATYADRGPMNMRVWNVVDPATQKVIAIKRLGSWMVPERTIWMDGRPHPPEYAPHTWQGFSTGKWQGNTLTVRTTHLKMAFIQRNGVAHSDQATMTEHFFRHGDVLSVATIVDDPVYLTEPFIRTSSWVYNLRQDHAPYPCGPNEIVVEIPRAEGELPHHLPGTNRMVMEFAAKHGLPFVATRGGADTTYPEYMETLKRLVATPQAVAGAR